MSKRRKSKAAAEAEERTVAPSVECSIHTVQTELRLRLSQGRVPPVIHGLEHEKRQLYELLQRTATTGESNSVLVIGPRGSGKSVLLKSVLDDLMTEEDITDNLLQVHLNGLLQTDDKIALKEITRQLHLENSVGDKVFGSFAENLQFLLEALKSGDQSSKPILFILDEFDLFAHHKNQTLLYNLFDIAQSAQAPICVIGITCRLDVIELLEKRVKSRFSHRQIHIFNKLSFTDYVEVFKAYLSLTKDFPNKAYMEDWNQSIQVRQSFIMFMSHLALSEEATVKDILKRQYEFSKDIRALQQLMMYPVCQLSDHHTQLTVSDFVDSMKILNTDTKSSMLHGVSILELCLIVSMKHLTDIYEGEPFNFEMVYSEYSKFAQRRTSMQVFEKAVVLKAFEHLLALELVKTIDGAGSRVQKEYRLMSLLIHPSQITDALQKYPNCPTDIKQWASNALAT
ncbi:hypothetical protein FSP39_012004 [Pinctada imbricata]|uniref:Origin recognition complex subunit 4 n=1 Tax=Pinctada imbricata TaxID=66713 RepID=A0AA88YR32_PINIB|nr:hypothetical protein FSP39_012004 [Pinctada imbricata]